MFNATFENIFRPVRPPDRASSQILGWEVNRPDRLSEHNGGADGGGAGRCGVTCGQSERGASQRGVAGLDRQQLELHQLALRRALVQWRVERGGVDEE